MLGGYKSWKHAILLDFTGVLGAGTGVCPSPQTPNEAPPNGDLTTAARCGRMRSRMPGSASTNRVPPAGRAPRALESCLARALTIASWDRLLFLGAIGLLPAGPAGCRGCEEDRPYTPFGEVSALPASSASTSSPPGAPSSATPQASASLPHLAKQAPRGKSRWRLGEHELTAPKQHVFVSGLTADLNGDGTEEAVAWVAPTEGRGGALWVYPKQGPAREVWRLPDFVPTRPTCQLETKLAQTGRQTVTVAVGAECSDGGIQRVPVRSVAVLAPLTPSPEVIAIRAAAPAPGESLAFEVDSTDRDQDGRDDVILRISAGTAPGGPAAAAQLDWLDRAAGPARDPKEPTASLRAAAARATRNARQKKASSAVLTQVAAVRRLYASVCSESGTARVFDSDGHPYSCGSLAGLAEQLATAEVQAALAGGDVLTAVGVLTRGAWFLAPLSGQVRSQLVEAIRKRAPELQPTEVVRLIARAAPRKGPRWSPLAFEQPDPTLLVRTAAGMVRVSADGTREQPANPDSGVTPWSLDVSSPDGKRTWMGVSQACDRSELLADFSGHAEPLPGLLAARPGLCGGKPIPPVPPPTPLGWDGDQLAAIVAGARVGDDPGRPRPGGPRSPDGSTLALSTPLGVLVIGPRGAELWKVEELSPAHDVGDCVAANRGQAIACVRGTEIFLVRR